jgi:hypothetical protein
MTTTPPSDDRQRKLCHALIDSGLATAIASGKPFTIERVLDSIGIHSLSLHRAQAFEYATKMLDAHRKANPVKEK